MIRQTKTENGLVRGIEAADPRITAFRGVPLLHRLQGRIAGAHLSRVRIGKE